jgi:uncharacterized protein
MSREHSMEDILSSIRKVIARDDAPALNDEVEADVLELHAESTGDATPHAPSPANDKQIVGSATAFAARRSLDALSAAVEFPETAAAPAPTALPPGSRTIDDVVIEALRPMLKQWLDTNLPPLVDAMVAKEIARITGRRG